MLLWAINFVFYLSVYRRTKLNCSPNELGQYGSLLLSGTSTSKIHHLSLPHGIGFVGSSHLHYYYRKKVMEIRISFEVCEGTHRMPRGYCHVLTSKEYIAR